MPRGAGSWPGLPAPWEIPGPFPRYSHPQFPQLPQPRHTATASPARHRLGAAAPPRAEPWHGTGHGTGGAEGCSLTQLAPGCPTGTHGDSPEHLHVASQVPTAQAAAAPAPPLASPTDSQPHNPASSQGFSGDSLRLREEKGQGNPRVWVHREPEGGVGELHRQPQTKWGNSGS